MLVDSFFLISEHSEYQRYLGEIICCVHIMMFVITMTIEKCINTEDITYK